jgi:hypothetical protein
MQKNPFEVLGIHPRILKDLTRPQIISLASSQYRTLQKIFHPDVGGKAARSQELTEAFQQIENAEELEILVREHSTPSSNKRKAEELEGKLEQTRSDVELFKKTMGTKFLGIFLQEGLELAQTLRLDREIFVITADPHELEGPSAAGYISVEQYPLLSSVNQKRQLLIYDLLMEEFFPTEKIALGTLRKGMLKEFSRTKTIGSLVSPFGFHEIEQGAIPAAFIQHLRNRRISFSEEEFRENYALFLDPSFNTREEISQIVTYCANNPKPFALEGNLMFSAADKETAIKHHAYLFTSRLFHFQRDRLDEDAALKILGLLRRTARKYGINTTKQMIQIGQEITRADRKTRIHQIRSQTNFLDTKTKEKIAEIYSENGKGPEGKTRALEYVADK